MPSSMPSPTPNGTPNPTRSAGRSFEQQLTELEGIVEQLERGDLTLEDSVALFERGMHLSEACKAELAGAEGRIQVLLQPSPRGAVRAEEFSLSDNEDERPEGESEEG